MDTAMQRQRAIAIAIVVGVGIVHAAACIQRKADAAAGIDAVGLLPAAIDAKPAALRLRIHARTRFAQAMAARADAQSRVYAGRPAPGEDLDDATDRIGAIETRARTAHDLDALDRLDRDVLQRGQSRRR